MPPPYPAAPPAVTRRLVLGAGVFGTGVLGAGLLAPAAGRAAAAEALHVTTYDGFVPPAVRQRFQAETGIAVRIRPVASQAPELTLLAAERDRPTTDLCTVAASRLHQFVDAGIVEPIDTGRLRHWRRIDRRYAAADWNRMDGATVGVPLLLGANVLVHDAGAVRPAPDTWAAMFDPAYRGRTTCNVEDFLLCTMLLDGADPTFVSYRDDAGAAQRAVDVARNRMIAGKSQVVRYFEDGGELQMLLTGGDAVLAQTYSSVPGRLILAGRPFGRVVPREGSMAFVYTLALVRNGPNPDAAYRFLDALLGTPDVAAALTRSSGYASTFVDAGAGLTAAEQAAFGLPEEALDRLVFPRFEGQALGSALIDRAVEEVRAG